MDKNLVSLMKKHSPGGGSVKKVFLEISQNSQENNCVGVSFFNKETQRDSTKVFSCEFCEIFKNTFFYKTPPVAVSVNVGLITILSYCTSLEKSNTLKVSLKTQFS